MCLLWLLLLFLLFCSPSPPPPLQVTALQSQVCCHDGSLHLFFPQAGRFAPPARSNRVCGLVSPLHGLCGVQIAALQVEMVTVRAQADARVADAVVEEEFSIEEV